MAASNQRTKQSGLLGSNSTGSKPRREAIFPEEKARIELASRNLMKVNGLLIEPSCSTTVRGHLYRPSRLVYSLERSPLRLNELNRLSSRNVSTSPASNVVGKAPP